MRTSSNSSLSSRRRHTMSRSSWIGYVGRNKKYEDAMKLIKCRIRGTRLFLVEKGDKFPENCCTPGYCTEIIPYKDNPPQCGRPVKYKIECCHDLDGIGTG